MKTIGQVLKLSCEFLASKKSSQGRLEVEHLIASTLNMKRLDLYLKFDAPLDENELFSIRKRLTRLANGEPLAYIEGSVTFFDLELNVDPRVLIPRPETELLVNRVVTKLKGTNLEKKSLWDICTGSGCIGLAIKKSLPELTVTLSDISKDAASVAKENAVKNTLAVDIVVGDLFDPFTNEKTDYIVCNPPYIKNADFATLDSHVREYEPRLALTSGDTGLEFYERLSILLPRYLKPGGIVWIEIGAGQEEEIRELFKSNSIQTISDYAGHTRIFEIKQSEILERFS